MILDRDIKPDRRVKTISFKVTKKEDEMIKAEVKRLKLTHISDFLAMCVFERIGKAK
jgi:hypothetical protein